MVFKDFLSVKLIFELKGSKFNVLFKMDDFFDCQGEGLDEF